MKKLILVLLLCFSASQVQATAVYFAGQVFELSIDQKNQYRLFAGVGAVILMSDCVYILKTKDCDTVQCTWCDKTNTNTLCFKQKASLWAYLLGGAALCKVCYDYFGT